MNIFYIIGGLLTLVGLGLYVREVTGTGEKPIDAASAGAMGFSYNGPSAIILVIFGVAITLFPHSPWGPAEEIVALPTTTTTTSTTTTTTTLPPVVTQVDPNYYPPSFPTFEFIPEDYELVYPSAPYDVRLAGDGERLADGHEPASQCATTPAIAWEPGDVNMKVDWYLEIEAYAGETYLFSEVWDSAINDWVFGWTPSGQAWPGWCFWEMYDPTLIYDVWIYAYNENGYSEPGYILITP